jgi:hypothetical protein
VRIETTKTIRTDNFSADYTRELDSVVVRFSGEPSVGGVELSIEDATELRDILCELLGDRE